VGGGAGAGRDPRAARAGRGRAPALRVKAAGRPIAFICRSGRRSAQAAQIAADAGVAGVINVDGGMGAWADAGLPLVPEGGTVV
jgi:rhodanese-related sulfurtransferase